MHLKLSTDEYIKMIGSHHSHPANDSTKSILAQELDSIESSPYKAKLYSTLFSSPDNPGNHRTSINMTWDPMGYRPNSNANLVLTTHKPKIGLTMKRSSDPMTRFSQRMQLDSEETLGISSCQRENQSIRKINPIKIMDAPCYTANFVSLS